MTISVYGKQFLTNWLEPGTPVKGQVIAIARLEIRLQSSPGKTQFRGWLYHYFAHGEAVAGYWYSLQDRRAITDAGVGVPIHAVAASAGGGESFAGHQFVAWWDVAGIPFQFLV